MTTELITQITTEICREIMQQFTQLIIICCRLHINRIALENLTPPLKRKTPNFDRGLKFYGFINIIIKHSVKGYTLNYSH